MKKIAFIVALFISIGTITITPSCNVSADWLVGYNMARDSSNLPENYVGDVILTLLLWLLLIFTFLCVISFVITGIMFLAAGSDPKLAENAKSAVKYSIIGIAVGLSGYVIINFISTTLGGTVQGV